MTMFRRTRTDAGTAVEKFAIQENKTTDRAGGFNLSPRTELSVRGIVFVRCQR